MKGKKGLYSIALDVLPFFEDEAKKRQGMRTDITPLVELSSRGMAAEQVGKLGVM